MDWKLFATTFAAIFVAELGDKTQLATLSLAAGSSSRWIVFAGSALALVATSGIAVLLGEGLSRTVPLVWIRRGAGVLFVVLGVLFLTSGLFPTSASSGGDANHEGAKEDPEGEERP